MTPMLYKSVFKILKFILKLTIYSKNVKLLLYNHNDFHLTVQVTNTVKYQRLLCAHFEYNRYYQQLKFCYLDSGHTQDRNHQFLLDCHF